jgi:hypothetical protein
MKKLAGILSMAAGLGLACASSGAMAATECNGPLSGTVTGGVVVNAGDFCVLAGATVYGGARVTQGGGLLACNSTISGAIIANGASNVLIGPEEAPNCSGNLIHGGVHISNTGPGVLVGPPSISIENNVIQGGVHLIGNAGPTVVSANVIKGGLFCKNNTFDLEDEGRPNVIITGGITCAFAP